jgi:hypothetical protein
MVDFIKVLHYFENIEFQDNIETKRSATYIKKQGDLYHREVSISVLTDLSVIIRVISMSHLVDVPRGTPTG